MRHVSICALLCITRTDSVILVSGSPVRHESPFLQNAFKSVSVCLSLCLSPCLRVDVHKERFCPERYTRENRASAHWLPLKALCPVTENAAAVVHLASATLGSFRHSCSGRPPSLQASSFCIPHSYKGRVQPWAKSSAVL